MILAAQCDYCERGIDVNKPWVTEFDNEEQRSLDVCVPCVMIPIEERWRMK